jgi:uncharacterized membrane protein YphA (DoxX/SURF4 family)
LFQLSRFQLGLIFLSLLILRVTVGYHFFKEGTTKLKDGNFSSKGFLGTAKGPFAPYFKDMLDDPDGKQKLCVKEIKLDDGSSSFEFDTSLTFLLWDDYIDQATAYFGFGSPDLQETIAERRQSLADQIEAARKSDDKSIDTAELERQRQIDEASILALREQTQRVEDIFEDHKEQLDDFLRANQTELLSHFSTSDRLTGFERDGDSRADVATYVDSLRYQVDSIRSDRAGKLKGWNQEVVAIWDSLENQVNSLAVDAQAQRPPIPLFRQFDQDTSMSKVIDKVIPWFDTIIGVLLILGLFSRLASGAAALFLFSVIMTQPPWIPGTQPTYFYAIELAACLVIFATCAGRMGGLDYFFSNPSAKLNNDLIG